MSSSSRETVLSVNKPKLLITADFNAELADRLREHFDVITPPPVDTGESLAMGPHRDLLSDVTVIVCELDKVDAQTLAAAPHLKLVVSCRSMPVNVDLEACAERGITVATTPARNADVTAEVTFGLILATIRDFFAAARYMSAKSWTDDDVFEPYREFRGPSMVGRTVGVVGAGAIGRRVAARARAFESHVLFYDPFVTQESLGDLGELVSLETLFATADIITLHAPLIPQTQGMVTRAHLESMKKGVYFVNVGRAGLVDQDALRDVIQSGLVKRAGFDVYWHEPLPLDHWLFEADNVLLLPHIAGASDDVITSHSRIALDAIATWRASQSATVAL